MAEESTGNVETRLGQSVGPTATDADVSTQPSTLAGGDTSPSETTVKSNNMSDASKQESRAGKTGNEGSGKEADGGSDGHETEGSAASPTTKTAADAANKSGIRPTAPLKKPTSFKSVSINQKYLAKATSSTPPASTSKLVFSTEKGPTTPTSSSTTPTILGAKRRLVNKTVGALQTGAAGAGATAKPAEQKVWTKNQPPPVVNQKDLTDEELTKKFGIHISARLQTDGDTTEPKWGDEDDDEDWVPDVPAWTDPNKGAEPAVEEKPPSNPATPAATTPIAPPPPPPPPTKEAEKSAPAYQPAGPHPTVLAPSGKATLMTSKPTLVDKSAAAAKSAGPPASPWAKLPPVHAVPPASPVHASPSAFPKPGDRFNDRGPSPHRRELHADDYGRSAWSDRRPSHGREIFNSRTGELEPVADRPRHESGRPQLRLNKPSVFQRNTSIPPAEPSPAFQTHHGGPTRGDDFRRQRTSSNVSGGSGTMGRKLSFTNTSHYGANHSAIHDDELPPRRPYQAGPPRAPSVVHQSPVPAFATPTTSGVVSDTPLTPVLASVLAAEAEQEKLMKEHALLAKQRRLQQEAEEEAAKRERLRKKLEELERQDNERKAKLQKEKEEQERAEAEAKAAKERAEEEKREAERKRLQEEAAKAAAEKEAADKLATEKAAAEAATAKPEPYRPPMAQGHHSGRWQGHGQQHPNGPYDSRSPGRTFATPHGPSQHGDRYSRWGQQQQVAHQPAQAGPSPWGPIGERPRYGSHQDIGSGPRQYSGYAPHHQQGPPGAGPLSADRYPHHGTRGTSLPDRRELPTSQVIPTAPRDSRPGYSPRVQHAQFQQQHQQQQQPSFHQQDGSQASAQTTPVEPNKTAMSWRRPSFQDQQQQQLQPQPRGGFERNGVPQDAENRSNFPAQGPASANTQQRQPQTGPQARPIPTGPANRPSRFFPNSADLVLNHLGDQVQKDNAGSQETIQPTTRSPPSPPPPACPVSPEPKHSPVVRLPPISVPQGIPAERSPQGKSSGFSKEHPRSPRGHSSGIDAFTAVQNRIKEKIQAAHQTPHQPTHASPTRTFAKPDITHSIDAQVATTSKTALDSVDRQAAVTVSLPGNKSEDPLSLEPFTRPITEETLFGEMFAQTFGSLPQVRIPRIVSPAVTKPAPDAPPSGKPGKGKPRLRVESIDPFQITTVKDFTDKEGTRFIPVQLPGKDVRKEVPFTPTTGNFRKGKEGTWRAGKGGPKRPKAHGSGNSSPGPNSPRVNGPVTYTRQHGNGGMGMAGASRMMTEPVQ